ncbi:MAG: hypothetical protein IKR65_08525 [Selenomonadaceae bacterium]|nr:hypothetical protein [Selenomonadaceae bacterium]MBR6343933.1 hypothetical protein [Selenomonadaceae bacterium]
MADETEKQEKVLDKLTEISERLVKVETLIAERTDDNKEMHDKVKKPRGQNDGQRRKTKYTPYIFSMEKFQQL